MKVHRTDMLHEILVMVIYVLASPICFGSIYTGSTAGDGGMAYVVILFVTGITAITSIVLIGVTKKTIKNDTIEITMGLIPLAVSSTIFHFNFGIGTHDEFISTFYIGNTFELIVLYGISMLYKILRRKLST